MTVLYHPEHYNVIMNAQQVILNLIQDPAVKPSSEIPDRGPE